MKVVQEIAKKLNNCEEFVAKEQSGATQLRIDELFRCNKRGIRQR